MCGGRGRNVRSQFTQCCLDDIIIATLELVSKTTRRRSRRLRSRTRTTRTITNHKKNNTTHQHTTHNTQLNNHQQQPHQPHTNQTPTKATTATTTTTTTMTTTATTAITTTTTPRHDHHDKQHTTIHNNNHTQQQDTTTTITTTTTTTTLKEWRLTITSARLPSRMPARILIVACVSSLLDWALPHKLAQANNSPRGCQFYERQSQHPNYDGIAQLPSSSPEVHSLHGWGGLVRSAWMGECVRGVCPNDFDNSNHRL